MFNNPDAFEAWLQRAENDELLDRVTVLRDELEPAARSRIEVELARRGLSAAEVASHGAAREAECLRRADGSVRRCWRCAAPATSCARRWWRLYGILPIVPLERPVCPNHA
ncbi:MAG: hypothetical protein KF873_02255 [Gemmataceae bacterium]|nr:hypothetical protein [Gemmataceae bacterium]